MKVFIPILVGLLTLFCSCEHKELCYTHPHFAKIRVEFDMDNIAEGEMPEGMRVSFFPIDGKSDVWTYDFPGCKGAVVEVPENSYHVLCYNYDTSGIVWQNEENFYDFLADTRDHVLPDGAMSTLTPSWLCGDDINMVDLKDIEHGTERVVLLTPKKMVCRYTFEVRGIRNVGEIADMRASLSSMSGALIMAGDKLPDGLSETLTFDAELTGGIVKGGFYTFGRSSHDEGKNIFTLFVKSRQGDVYKIEEDVTEQVRKVPLVGHLGDVHLIIDADYEIPITPGDNPGDEGGFIVDVDEWEDVKSDIIA